MSSTITKKEAGLILLIDFKKAFDSLRHSFIFIRPESDLAQAHGDSGGLRDVEIRLPPWNEG